MTVAYTERSELERGFAGVFAGVFAERIAPRLEELEAERRRRVAAARRQMAMALGAGALVALLLSLTAAGSAKDLIFTIGLPMVASAVGAWLLWRRHAARWEGALAARVMPVVCEFVGDLDYDHAATRGFPLEHAKALGAVPAHDRARLSDRLSGRYRDTAFEIVEARLQVKRSDDDGDSRKTDTVFRGLLFRVETPEEIPSKILIARDLTKIGNMLGKLFSGDAGRGMPKVELPHPEFERRFEVHAEDPDVARQVLAPAFLDNLLLIDRHEGAGERGPAMQAAFHGRDFFLALNRQDGFLEMGALSRPVGDIEEALHRVFDDIALVRRVIDRLHGDHAEAGASEGT
ncbi:MAG: DUF3137 domain-containing protein [Pseudomonadota bacterium]